MNLSKPKLTKIFPEFGIRSYDSDYFWHVVEWRKFQVAEMKLKKRGYFTPHIDGDLIFINSKLRDFLWLCVAYHELVHAILHYPSPFLSGKHQFEANAFSIMLICTLDDLRADSEIRYIARYNRVARHIIKQREQIKFLYQDFGFNQSNSVFTL